MATDLTDAVLSLVSMFTVGIVYRETEEKGHQVLGSGVLVDVEGRRDRVAEATFYESDAARRCVLQELPDFSIFHNRRDAEQKAASGGPFLGRTFHGICQKARDRRTKTLRREEGH